MAKQNDDDNSNLGSLLGGFAKRVRDFVPDLPVGGLGEQSDFQTKLAELRKKRFSGGLSLAVSSLVELHENSKEEISERQQKHLLAELALLEVHRRLFGLDGDIAQLKTLLNSLNGKVSPSEELSPFVELLAATATTASLTQRKDALRRSKSQLRRNNHPLGDDARLLLRLLLSEVSFEEGEALSASYQLEKAWSFFPKEVPATKLVDRFVTDSCNYFLALDRPYDAEEWLHRLLQLHRAIGGERPAPLSGASPAKTRILAVQGRWTEARQVAQALSAEKAEHKKALFTLSYLHRNEDPQQEPPQIFAAADPSASQLDPLLRRMKLIARCQQWEKIDSADEEKALLNELGQGTTEVPESKKYELVNELEWFCLRSRLGPSALTFFSGAKPDQESNLESSLLRLWSIVEAAEKQKGSATFLDAIEKIEKEFFRSELNGPLQQEHIPRVELPPEITPPLGPDEWSPLRNPILRRRVIDSRRVWLEARYALLLNHEQSRGYAQKRLIEAIGIDPHFQAAFALLSELSTEPLPPAFSDRLLFAEKKLGEPSIAEGLRDQSSLLQDVQSSRTQFVAIKERLSQPFTLAVMGEFSAGKSSLVNALLGRNKQNEIAPTGALPTTSTVNVFRPGRRSGARIHYRDGRIDSLDEDLLTVFLNDLSEEDAASIRTLEISVEESSATSAFAHTSIVDTPGLNALDAYHESVAREFLEQADAIIWVFSATRGCTASEKETLEQLHASGRSILGVINKSDLLNDAEREEMKTYISEQVGDKLVDILLVSSLPSESNNEQSLEGFEELRECLDRSFFQQAQEIKQKLAHRTFEAILLRLQQGAKEHLQQLESLPLDSAPLEKGRDALFEFASNLTKTRKELTQRVLREVLRLRIDDHRQKIDALDLHHLHRRLKTHVVQLVEQCTAQLPPSMKIVGSCVNEHFVPWLRGYLDSLKDVAFFEQLRAKLRNVRGEQAIAQEIDEQLRPLFRSWNRALIELRKPLEEALDDARRTQQQRRYGNSIHLRTSLLGPIDALLTQTSDSVSAPDKE